MVPELGSIIHLHLDQLNIVNKNQIFHGAFDVGVRDGYYRETGYFAGTYYNDGVKYGRIFKINLSTLDLVKNSSAIEQDSFSAACLGGRHWATKLGYIQTLDSKNMMIRTISWPNSFVINSLICPHKKRKKSNDYSFYAATFSEPAHVIQIYRTTTKKTIALDKVSNVQTGFWTNSLNGRGYNAYYGNYASHHKGRYIVKLDLDAQIGAQYVMYGQQLGSISSNNGDSMIPFPPQS